MFSFMQSNQNFIVGKHSTMVENRIENTWCRMLEGIFDFSSFENNIEISKSVARKIRTIIFSKWLVDEELAKNSSLHFELISTIVASRNRKIGMKMLIKIEILLFQFASHNFFYWSIGFMIKMLLFKFASFTISKRALEMTFKSHSWVMLYNTDWCYKCMTPWYIARGGLQLEYRYSECYIN